MIYQMFTIQCDECDNSETVGVTLSTFLQSMVVDHDVLQVECDILQKVGYQFDSRGQCSWPSKTLCPACDEKATGINELKNLSR